jgi:DNA-binding transcriptional regulator YdaS (Cro superfamily)
MEHAKSSQQDMAHALDRAALATGGRVNLSQVLDVTLGALGNWKIRGVPIERCYAIERATNGVVTRKDLRPDDWQEIWPELATTNPTTEPAAAGV